MYDAGYNKVLTVFDAHTIVTCAHIESERAHIDSVWPVGSQHEVRGLAGREAGGVGHGQGAWRGSSV